MQIAEPHCRVFDSESLDEAQDCISKLPGDGEAAGLGSRM